MKSGVTYSVFPKGNRTDIVGEIKDGTWYEKGQSYSSVKFDHRGRASIMQSDARLEGLTLIRESDGQEFDLVAKD